jgi:ribosomal protein S18 acetylase RimI-like enzyme
MNDLIRASHRSSDWEIERLDHRDVGVAQEIHAVLDLAYAQEAELLQLVNSTEVEQDAEAIMQSELSYSGARQHGSLLGWISLGPDDEPQQYSIAMLVVRPEQQRRGIALALLGEAMQQAGGSSLSVVCACANRPAMALYQQLGFSPYRRGMMGKAAIEVVKLKIDLT